MTSFRVLVIDGVRESRSWRVEHVSEPYEGIKEYVESRQLLCAWSEWPAYERDERRAAEVRAASLSQRDASLREACNIVMSACGYDAYLDDDGAEIPQVELERMAKVAGLRAPDLIRPPAFTDRQRPVLEVTPASGHSPRS